MVDYGRYKWLRAERRGRVLTVTMTRPDMLNAANAEMHRELSEIFDDVQRDPESAVCVLTGAGRAFSAGGDLGWAKDCVDKNEFPATWEAKRLVFAMLDLEKPLVGRVNGHAIGLGATLALLCDVTFMVAGAKIGDTHVKAGVAAGDGGCVIWPYLVGFTRAKHYLMTGDLIEAQEAERLGLITFAVAPGELDARVNAYAERLAAGPVQAINGTKTSINVLLKQVAHTLMDTCYGYEALCFRTADHREAVAAFLEKRPPRFIGR
jgi:enoyl-CoA hydratase